MAVKRYKGAKAKADTLFSQVIRSLGYCEAAGFDNRPCSSQLQTAHIISRRLSATRTDTRNAFCLCFAHHRRFHDYPREFSRFITTTWAADHYDAIYDKANPTEIKQIKIDWNERAEFLKRIKNGEITLQEARSVEDA